MHKENEQDKYKQDMSKYIVSVSQKSTSTVQGQEAPLVPWYILNSSL